MRSVKRLPRPSPREERETGMGAQGCPHRTAGHLGPAAAPANRAIVMRGARFGPVTAELRSWGPHDTLPAMLSTGARLDLNSVFVKRFGDLVALLRVDPGNDAAQDLALSAAASAVSTAAADVDSANEEAGSPEGLGLRARMIARQVDRLRVGAGAEPYELQAVARALAHDLTPIPSMPHVEVELMRLLAPPSR